MNLTDRLAEVIYRLATTKNKLRIILTPVGATFWLSILVVLVFASVWLDQFFSLTLFISSPVKFTLAILLLLVASTLIGWSILSFIRARGTPVPVNPPKKLVVTGLYIHLRNPMVLGYIVLLYGIGVLLSSFSLILISAPLFSLLNFLYLKTIEEKEMEKKFGQQYLEYKRNVPMFIPEFGRRR